MGYGEGAVMGVPAHDERDFEFAQKYGLPIRPWCDRRSGAYEPVAATPGSAEYGEHGVTGELRQSSTGLIPGGRRCHCGGARARAASARKRVHWRLRDWGISRQRYWGCPIPLIHCEQLRRGAGAR